MRKRLHEPTGSRPTVNDVARAAGVSTATVSRVLNASADVSEALKIKVTETMAQLGYVRDATARALATRRSFRLGIILPSRTGPIVSSILTAFEAGCKSRNFTLMVVRTTWAQADIQDSFRRQLEHGVEGVFAAGPLDLADFTTLTSSRNVALVSLSDGALPAAINSGASGADLSENGTPTGVLSPAQPGTIDFALCHAARRLAAYLSDLGHRHIAIITEPHAEAPLCAGLVQGLTQGGFSGPLTVEAAGTVEAGAHIFSALMEQVTPPTAIICATATVAAGVYFEASRRGLLIPDDVSIAALASPPTARAMAPALSGIDIDADEIGLLAVEALISRIEARPAANHLRLPAGLTLRDSLGPPKTA